MPEIAFEKVSAFSSEDAANQLFANNLLKTKDFKSWKCRQWEDKSHVILETTDAYKVDNIEIGNDCSAFAEVLVSNTSAPNARFQVLLSTSSFMTPSDSKQLQNCHRIRCFPNDKLSPNARTEKWNRFKIVCTQPFNKDIPYGLAFIRFNTRAEEDEEMDVSSNLMALNTGPFRLRSHNTAESNESRDEEADTSAGSLFKNRNNYTNSDPQKPSSLATTTGVTPPPKQPKVQNSVKPKQKTPQTTSKQVLSSHSTAPSSSTTTSIKSPKRQWKPKTDVPFNQLMSKVVFALSGFVNPKRSDLRDKAIKMGAKYRPDWSQTCTHLICAFANTPKYNEVLAQKGRIVSEKWIEDTFNQKRLVYWRNYLLGKYRGPDSEESEDEEEVVVPKNRKRIQYIDDDEEEESQMKEVIGFAPNSSTNNNESNDNDMNDEIYDMETDNESGAADNSNTKSDKTIDPKPTIDIFKERCFHLYGPFDEKEKQILTQHIISHNGKLETQLSSSVRYVVTNSDWNDDFDQACTENDSLIIVKPKWIYKCIENAKLIPPQAFTVSSNYD